MGLVGAALVALVTAIAWNIIRGYYSYKVYKQEFEIRRLLHINIIAIIVFVLALFLILSKVSLWIIIPSKLFILALYPLLLWATKALSESECKQIVNLIAKFRLRRLFSFARNPH